VGIKSKKKEKGKGKKERKKCSVKVLPHLQTGLQIE